MMNDTTVWRLRSRSMPTIIGALGPHDRDFVVPIDDGTYGFPKGAEVEYFPDGGDVIYFGKIIKGTEERGYTILPLPAAIDFNIRIREGEVDFVEGLRVLVNPTFLDRYAESTLTEYRNELMKMQNSIDTRITDEIESTAKNSGLPKDHVMKHYIEKKEGIDDHWRADDQFMVSNTTKNILITLSKYEWILTGAKDYLDRLESGGIAFKKVGQIIEESTEPSIEFSKVEEKADNRGKEAGNNPRRHPVVVREGSR